MRVLVTGASGFIGLPVVRCLEQQGQKVLALSRNVSNEQLASSSNWLKADLSLPETYHGAIQTFAPEVLIHLAWQGIPDFSFETSRMNLNHSLDLLSFVVGLGSCKKILVSGSCYELNRLKGNCTETEKGTPKDDFTWAKHTLRSWLEVICAKEKIDLGWVRVFYVYGPRQRQESLIPSILTRLQSERLPQLRTPQNANDFVFVEDVAEAFSNAVSNELPSNIYNLGSGSSTPVQEICRMAEQIVLGTDSLTRQLEEKTLESTCNVDFWADCSNAKKYLEWEPTTSLEEGVEKTWKWFAAR
jgi:nucleoside-diphosphate-sugar epimerase